MYSFTTLFSFLLALLCSTHASFYDNPTLEFPPEGGTSIEELERKWGTDVSFLTV